MGAATIRVGTIVTLSNRIAEIEGRTFLGQGKVIGKSRGLFIVTWERGEDSLEERDDLRFVRQDTPVLTIAQRNAAAWEANRDAAVNPRSMAY